MTLSFSSRGFLGKLVLGIKNRRRFSSPADNRLNCFYQLNAGGLTKNLTLFSILLIITLASFLWFIG